MVEYKNMVLWVLISLFLHPNLAFSQSAGWKSYYTENIDEFHDILLKWETDTPIPRWVTGTFVRNGAARIRFNSSRRVFSSWLEGWAKIHSFKFNGSRVLFSGKMLESPNYLASVAKGELTPQFTFNKFEDPDDEWTSEEKVEISRKAKMGTAYDNSNPAVWRIGPADVEKGIYMAVTDNPVATRFDIDTLQTLGMETPHSNPITASGCAHWMREPGTDNSININLKIKLQQAPYFEVSRYRPEHTYQDPETVATFEPRKPGYFHSFSITEDYVVLFIYPVTVEASKLFSNGFHLMEAMKQDRNDNTDIYIINLKTSEVTHRTVDYVYSLHHANAYQDGHKIVVDLATNRFESLRDYMKLKSMLNPPNVVNLSEPSHIDLLRYRIDLKSEDVQIETFKDESSEHRFLHHFEFPTINEEYRGKHYCILYGWSEYQYTRQVLVKKNMCDDSLSKTWSLDNHYSGEMSFIANPESKSEDDGILVATIYDGDKEKSYLLVFDAKRFVLINKAYLPHNIPPSSHGMYFPEAQLNPEAQQYVKVKSEL